MINHRVRADRILHDADSQSNPIERERLVALANAHAMLALAEETHTGNLIRLLRFRSLLPGEAKGILLALIRRRLEVIPPFTSDGSVPNGGG